MNQPESKPFGISKHAVLEAWKRVKANRGAAGVDEESVQDFERKLRDNLFSWRQSMSTGRSFTYVEPSRKAQMRLRDAVRRELNHWTRHRSTTEAVRCVNRIAHGWSNYFHYKSCTASFNRANSFLERRLRRWLWTKYDCTLGKHTFFTADRLYGQYQLWKLPTTSGWTR